MKTDINNIESIILKKIIFVDNPKRKLKNDSYSFY